MLQGHALREGTRRCGEVKTSVVSALQEQHVPERCLRPCRRRIILDWGVGNNKEFKLRLIDRRFPK